MWKTCEYTVGLLGKAEQITKLVIFSPVENPVLSGCFPPDYFSFFENLFLVQNFVRIFIQREVFCL